jgi:hypothetical protein
MDRLPNDSLLTSASIPGQRASWKEIAEFAQTFDGYEHFPDGRCANLANRTRKLFHQDPNIHHELNLYELRACLFFEQRRYKHFGRSPIGPELDYFYSLLSEIARKCLIPG